MATEQHGVCSDGEPKRVAAYVRRHCSLYLRWLVDREQPVTGRCARDMTRLERTFSVIPATHYVITLDRRDSSASGWVSGSQDVSHAFPTWFYV